MLVDGANGIKRREIVPESTFRAGTASADLVPEFIAAGECPSEFPSVGAVLQVVLESRFAFRLAVQTNAVGPQYIFFCEGLSSICAVCGPLRRTTNTPPSRQHTSQCHDAHDKSAGDFEVAGLNMC